MDFGQGLAVLKRRGRIRRPRWKSGEFLELRYNVRLVPQLTACGVLTSTSWYPTHEDLLAEDWVRIDDDTPLAASQRRPSAPDTEGEQRVEPAEAEDGEDDQFALSFNVSTSIVLSDDDIDQLIARIANRVACRMSPGAGVTVATR